VGRGSIGTGIISGGIIGIAAGAKAGGGAGHCGIGWFVAQTVLLVGANDRSANWNWHSPHVDTFWPDRSLHIVVHGRSLEDEKKNTRQRINCVHFRSLCTRVPFVQRANDGIAKIQRVELKVEFGQGSAGIGQIRGNCARELIE